MKLFLVRHTHVAVAPEVCYGQSDVNLASSFPEESATVVRALKNEHFDRIYSSPLKRCVLLAEKIAGEQKIVFDARLKELNFGDWENKRWEDIREETTALFTDYKINNKCPGGESFLDLIERVRSFFVDMNDQPGSVCVVAHGGVIRAFMALMEQRPPLELFRATVDYGQVFCYDSFNPKQSIAENKMENITNSSC